MRSYRTDALNVHDNPDKSMEQLYAREHTKPFERPVKRGRFEAPRPAALSNGPKADPTIAQKQPILPPRPHRPGKARAVLTDPHLRSPAPTPPPQQRSSDWSDSDDELPTLSRILEQARRRPWEPHQLPCRPDQPCGLELRDWDVEELVDKRSTDGDFEYLVRWENSRLAARYVRDRADGSKFVECSGRVWDVVTATPVARVNESDERMVDVAWAESWNSGADLRRSVQHLIDAPDTRLASRTDDQEEPRSENARVVVRSKASDKIFTPSAGIDYGPHVRAVLADDDPSHDVKLMLGAQAVREVVFSDRFIHEGRRVNLNSPSKANAMLGHDSGYEQAEGCEPCEAGKGPFRECVAMHSSVSACTSCQFRKRGPSCNFHNKHPRHREYVREHADPTLADQDGPETPSTPTLVPSSPTAPSDTGFQSSIRPASPVSDGTEPTSPMDGPFSPVASPLPQPTSSGFSFATAVEGLQPSTDMLSRTKPLHRDERSDCNGLTTDRSDHAGMSGHGVFFAGGAAPPSRQRHSLRLESTEASPEHALHHTRKRKALLQNSQDDNSDDEDPQDQAAHSDTDSSDRPRRAAKPDAHANCPSDQSLCVAYIQPRAMPHGVASSSIPDGTVYSDHIFTPGSATIAQVHFVLSHLPCKAADNFDEHWQAFHDSRVEWGEEVEMTREQHVRDWLWRELNRAVRVCCPRRSGRAGDGESAETAIVVSDD